MLLYGATHAWGETHAAKAASHNKRKKKKQLDHTNTGTESHTPHFPLLLQSPAFQSICFFFFFWASFVSNPMAQQPLLERQLKSPIGKTLNEERAPFSRSQKGRKGIFPRPAALPLPQPRRWPGTRAVARCWGPGRRRGASDNTGSVCRRPRSDAAGSAELPCRCQRRHKGSPGPPALPVTPVPGLALSSALLLGDRQGEAVLLAALSHRSETPWGLSGATGCIPASFLSRRLASWLGPRPPRGCPQRGTVPSEKW